ncbi:MAG: rhodanese-like domain-containing protein [Woeseiaceae bacterium]
MKLAVYIFATSLIFASGTCSAQAIKSVADYKAEAEAAVSAINMEDAQNLVRDDSTVFVDVREKDEIDRLGEIEGSVHVPRGVLEFYIDPKSSMHMDIFSSGKRVIFYCATGGRSLLAAKVAKDMGIRDPLYLDGGFGAWSEANETESR